jgi:hypothetical protein
MMAYLKPQSPLNDAQGNYIYPLTTVDQIIMEDGRRLSSVNFSSSLPFVTDEDNGKILRVVNGAWTAVALQYAEEVSV